MEPQFRTVPEESWPYDPPAVALGNASLLGIGYLMLGRRGLALATGAVTITLITVLVVVANPWLQVAVLLWWALMIAHGLRLGRTVPCRGRRWVAFGAAAAMLLVIGFLRLDAAGIGRSVAQARERGDCTGVLTAQGRAWLGHRVADAPLARRDDAVAVTCRRLRSVQAKLDAGLNGDTGAASVAFDALGELLRAGPGDAKLVGATLDAFLAKVPAQPPCRTADITAWLTERTPTRDLLDRSARTAARTGPAALLACGDELVADKDWREAGRRYQRVITLYPDDPRVADARDGITRAERGEELEKVESLLDSPEDGGLPEYCSEPAKYSGAPKYGEGKARALFVGDTEYTDRLPGGWSTGEAADAALVVCADTSEQGPVVAACHYSPEDAPGTLRKVSFHTIEVPVKIFELRTGKRVADRKVEISGKSCPPKLSYLSSTGLPADQVVDPSKADVRAAFRPLIRG